MAFDNSVAAMEAFFGGFGAKMEDDVNIDVSVEAPPVEEAVEETATDVEAAEEVTETTEEAESEAESGVEMCREYDRLDRAIDCIQRYGVNRTVLMLYPEVMAVMRRKGAYVAGVESYDAMGDARSSDSIAALEGLKEAAKSVWKWIKKVVGKITSLIMRFVDAIRIRFGNLDANVGRLRKTLKNKTDKTGDEIKDVKVKVTPKSELESAFADVFTKLKGINGINDELTHVIDSLENGIKNNATFIDSKGDTASASVSGTRVNGTQTIAAEDRVKELNDMDKKLSEQLKDIKLPDTKEVEASGATSAAGGYLDFAAEKLASIRRVEANITAGQAVLKAMKKVADLGEARDDSGARDFSAACRKTAMVTQKFFSIQTSILSKLIALVQAAVKYASMYIRVGTKSF